MQIKCPAVGLLFFLMVRYKQLLWQPQYILLKNISACGVGMSCATALVVFSSILRKQTQIYGCWCIAVLYIAVFFPDVPDYFGSNDGRTLHIHLSWHPLPAHY